MMTKKEVREYLIQILNVYEEMEQESLAGDEAKEEYSKVETVLFDAIDNYFDDPMAEQRSEGIET